MTRKQTKYNKFLIISDTNQLQTWFAIGIHPIAGTLATNCHDTEDDAIKTMKTMVDKVDKNRAIR